MSVFCASLNTAGVVVSLIANSAGRRQISPPADAGERGNAVAAAQRQPACSTSTARLKTALVDVGIVVGFVVVSEGVVKPPIQYQLCAMICCSRSIGSRVTIATPSTTETIESLGATSASAIAA